MNNKKIKVKDISIKDCCYCCENGRHEWGYGDEQWFECTLNINGNKDITNSFFTKCSKYKEGDE